jgi:hypothetical protein
MNIDSKNSLGNQYEQFAETQYKFAEKLFYENKNDEAKKVYYELIYNLGPNKYVELAQKRHYEIIDNEREEQWISNDIERYKQKGSELVDRLYKSAEYYKTKGNTDIALSKYKQINDLLPHIQTLNTKLAKERYDKLTVEYLK